MTKSKSTTELVHAMTGITSCIEKDLADGNPPLSLVYQIIGGTGASCLDGYEASHSSTKGFFRDLEEAGYSLDTLDKIGATPEEIHRFKNATSALYRAVVQGFVDEYKEREKHGLEAKELPSTFAKGDHMYDPEGAGRDINLPSLRVMIARAGGSNTFSNPAEIENVLSEIEGLSGISHTTASNPQVGRLASKGRGLSQ